MHVKNQKSLYNTSLFFLALTLLFAVCYVYFSTRSSTKDIVKFQTEINDIEQNLIQTTNQLASKKQIPSFEELIAQTSHNQLIHIYHDDTLARWNTNAVPANNLIEKSEDGISIQKATNGWYLTSTRNIKNVTIRVSEKIYDEYPFENSYIQNGFTDPKFEHLHAKLIFDAEIGTPIYSSKKTYLFSIDPVGKNKLSNAQEFLITTLLFLSIACFIRLIYLTTKQASTVTKILIWVGLLAFRWFSLEYNILSRFQDYALFQAHLFAVDFFSPNLFEFTLSILLLFYTCTLLLRVPERIKKLNQQAIYLIQSTLALLIWGIIAYYIHGFVFHSTIQLATDDLFALNRFSILAILLIGGCCLFYYQMVEHIHRNRPKQITLFVQIVLFSAWTIIMIFGLKFHWSLTFYPIVLYLLLLVFQLNNRIHSSLSYLIFGMVTSTMIATAIQHLNTKKEIENRPIFANQLFNERDYLAELSFQKVDTLLAQDRTLQFYLKAPEEFTSIRLEEYLSKKYFQQITNTYDVAYYLFDENNVNLGDLYSYSTQLHDDFSAVIEEHGIESELSPNITYIHDNIAQFSYLIHVPIKAVDGSRGKLVCTLKSKKIPETIGFPKLLMASPVDNQALLAHYSFARYHEDQLINQFGDFDYPYSSVNLHKWYPKGEKNFTYNGYNHSIYKDTQDNEVIVSIKIDSFFDLLTSVSFFFLCFLVLMVLANLPLVIREVRQFNWNRLATKIQFAILGLIVLAITATTWGAGSFFRKQFNDLTDQQIETKTTSVAQDLKAQIGRMSELPSHRDYSLMNQQLRRLSRIHKTDINIYNTNGHLIATSRQQLYNNGLLSEQMNPVAVQHIFEATENQFLNDENIGELTYSSSYTPLQNFAGEQIGALNLQLFGQQESIESQMNALFATLINIFLLIFVISTILTILIGNWITSPLRQLHTNLRTLKFGRNISRLQYHKKDEIGDLVEDYNLKLAELEDAAHQLAMSERESAWRDMAKQVAHEIKNPLTPMKLSVQHLQRSMELNPDDPNLSTKVNRVTTSIIEQIDALTRIANEFSNFAKMPAPQMEQIELVQLIQGVIDIFESQDNIQMHYTGLEQLTINGDRDQLLRVINNLVKNGMQAIQHSDGQIHVRTSLENEFVAIEIEDNGSGIPEEQLDRMFVPYFTTKSTGTGLGLSMVKQIVENHGGSITFKTEQNKGTTFRIRLPL